MKHYGYWRSAAAFRTRIALNLKGLEAEQVVVDVVGGEQLGDAYHDLNPLRLVPILVDGDTVIHGSLAIIEYLEELHPQPALLPGDAALRGRIRAVALVLTADTHPLHTTRVLAHLKDTFGADDDGLADWTVHWTGAAFSALEKTLGASAGEFCFGDQPTLADCCLVPQIIVGQRFGFDMGPYPTLTRIGERCLRMPEFETALPTHQSDAP